MYEDELPIEVTMKRRMTKVKVSVEDYTKINEILCECAKNANRAIAEFGLAMGKINEIAKGEEGWKKRD